MDVYSFYQLGTEPTYKYECLKDTSLNSFFYAIARYSLAQKISLQDAFRQSVAVANTAIIDKWFDPRSARVRITRQYVTPDSIAAVTNLPLPHCALIQYLYSRAGLMTRSEHKSDAIWTALTMGTGVSRILDAETLCQAACYGNFYMAEFVPIILDAGNKCANLVDRLIGSKAQIGASVVQEIARIINNAYRKLLVASQRGSAGLTYNHSHMLEAIQRYRARKLVGLSLDPNPSVVDQYSLIRNECLELDKIANFEMACPIGSIKDKSNDTPLAGSLKTLLTGIRNIDSLQILYKTPVDAAVADSYPVTILSKQKATFTPLIPDLTAMSSSRDQIIDLVPAARGTSIYGNPTITTTIFSGIVAEWELLVKALTCAFDCASSVYEVTPSLMTNIWQRVRSRVATFDTQTQMAYVETVGDVRYDIDSDRFVYGVPASVNVNEAGNILGAVGKNDTVYTTDLNTATVLALIHTGGASSDASFRAPLTGLKELSPDETFTNELIAIMRANTAYVSIIDTSSFRFKMRLPGFNETSTFSEPGAFQPWSVYGDKFLVLHDGRRFTRAQACVDLISSSFSSPETLAIAEEEFFAYTIQFLKQAVKMYGDRARFHLESTIGRSSPSTSAAALRARRSSIVLGAADLKLRTIAACDAALGTMINRVVNLTFKRAQAQGLNLVREAL